MPGSGPRSAPVAFVSRSTLSANAASARQRGARRYDPALLEADAWGHGAALVRDVLASQGLTPDAHGGRAAGAPDSGALAALELFGLPGAPSTSLPALRLTGTVLSVKDLRRGEGVSYGYAYRATADTRVALVTGGYAQGIARGLGGSIDVTAGGVRHAVVGRIAMDVCVVEIGDAIVARGSEVVFLGDPASGEPSLAEWLPPSGLTAEELVTTIGLRAIREEMP